MPHGGDDGLPEEHEEHVNHEAWVIPYADLLTLLMAMFIALFAMSSVDMDKFKALSIGFNEALGGGELSTGVFDPTEGGDGPFAGKGTGMAAQLGGAIGPDNKPVSNRVLEKLLTQYENRQVAQSVERESLRDVAQRIEQEAAATGFAGSLNLRLEERGLVVTVVTDQVLFDTASAELRSDGREILDIVAAALASVDNPIVVEGHTDARPISTDRFPSNWELAGGRAAAVVRYFEDLGVAVDRLTYEGYGERRPIASNDSEAGRAQNRRVEIVVRSKLIDAALRDAGLGRSPVAGLAPPVPNRIDGGIQPVRPNLGAGA